MFCSYCGTKMDEGAKFCSICGATVTNDSAPVAVPRVTHPPVAQPHVGQTPRPLFTLPTVQIPSGDVVGTFKNALNAFGTAKIWWIVALCTLFISPILGAFHGVVASVGLGDVSIGASRSWFEVWFGSGDGTGFGVLMWIVGNLLLIAAEVMMVYPLLLGAGYEAKSLRLAKIVGIGLAAFLVVSDIFLIVENQESAYYSLALTFWGWLLHIDTAAFLVSVFKFSGYLKTRLQ